MLRNILSALLLIVLNANIFNDPVSMYTWAYIREPGSRYPPTKGEVWPKPKFQRKSDTNMVIDSQKFEIVNVGEICDDLDHAIERYKNIVIFPYGKPKRRRSQTGRSQRRQRETYISPSEANYVQEKEFNTLYVNLSNPCETWPSTDMEESYSLKVKSEGKGYLQSESIWGILRGLETFSQLVYTIKSTSQINATIIVDEPRFKYRGLLLDTSRHFISMNVIFKILDAMAYNKLNVFHWHIVDDESFPYESLAFPRLAMGAYRSSMLYTRQDIASVINHARKWGIRVIPEFDTPGHTRSWGVAYPWLLAECYKNNVPDGTLGPIDPTNDDVYPFLSDLFKEVTTTFPDRYFHMGGDEVEYECWQTNPKMNEFMKSNNISSYQKLEDYYIQKVTDIVKNLSVTPIVYQEVYQNGINLPDNTIIQVWLGDYRALLYDITKSGYSAILSTCWYLDHLQTGGDWKKYYNCEPLDFIGTDEQHKLVLGGEACMWSEVVDDTNVISRIFPRASAAAEKLWSPYNASSTDEAIFRLEEHYCRMQRRGIPSQPPSGPGFCSLSSE